MGIVSAWLLSIAGVVILSVLAEFVLPEGQMNRYTKNFQTFLRVDGMDEGPKAQEDRHPS